MPLAFLRFNKIFCSFDETLAVSGNGSFTFDYLAPYLYVADEGAAGAGVFKIYDMSNPLGPALLSTQNTGAGTKPRNPKGYITPAGTRICLIPYNQSKQLGIWDCTDPTAPVLVGTCNLSFKPYGVAAIGNKACVCYFDSFLQTKAAEIVDISNLAAPALGGSWASSALASAIIASRTEFLVSGQGSSGGSGYLAALNGTTAALLSQVTGGGAFSGLDQYCAASADGNTAFYTNDGNGALISVNAANRSALANIQVKTGQYPSGSGPVIAYREDTGRLYLGRGSGGGLAIYIFDVTDPAAMVLTGTINTSGETTTDIAIMDDGCAGLAWGQGTGAAIRLLGEPPLA